MKQTNPKDEFIAIIMNDFAIQAKKIADEYFEKGYDKGKEEKLSSTYQSSKVYLMGYKAANNDLIEWIDNSEMDGFEINAVLTHLKNL